MFRYHNNTKELKNPGNIGKNSITPFSYSISEIDNILIKQSEEVQKIIDDYYDFIKESNTDSPYKKEKMQLLLEKFESSLEELSIFSEKIEQTILYLNINPKRKEKLLEIFEELKIRLKTIQKANSQNQEKLSQNDLSEEVFLVVKQDISAIGEELVSLRTNIYALRIEFRKLFE